jgi:pimeloyl-ACP methyl ester carboxylesterase
VPRDCLASLSQTVETGRQSGATRGIRQQQPGLFKLRHITAAIVLACAVGTYTRAETPATGAINDMSYIQPDRLVDIGAGRRLNVHCVGQGSPTVIFESGLGDQSRAWAMVQPAVGNKTQACSYDRAGLGFSDLSDRPGTSENAVNDLHRLLLAAAIKPPYILAGHSLGGMYVRLYTDRYRSEVVGLVLVDSVSEEQGRRTFALDPRTQKLNDDFVESIRTDCVPAAENAFKVNPAFREKCAGSADPRFSEEFNRAFLANHSRPDYFRAVYSEYSNVFTVSSDQVRAAKRSFGDLSLIVLRHAPFTRQPKETQEMRDAKNALWKDMQDDLAKLSSKGIDILVPGASHYIQFDNPQIVIDAIYEEINEAPNPTSGPRK